MHPNIQMLSSHLHPKDEVHRVATSLYYLDPVIKDKGDNYGDQ